MGLVGGKEEAEEEGEGERDRESACEQSTIRRKRAGLSRLETRTCEYLRDREGKGQGQGEEDLLLSLEEEGNSGQLLELLQLPSGDASISVLRSEGHDDQEHGGGDKEDG